MLKSLFKILFSYIFINFRKIRKFILLKENTYFYLDLFMIYLWLNKVKNISSNITRMYKTNVFGMKYFKKKIVYILFFEDKNLYSNINYLIYPKLNSLFLLSKENKFIYFFNKIYNYFFVNKFFTYGYIFHGNHIHGLKGLGRNIYRFFKYYYINFCYK